MTTAPELLNDLMDTGLAALAAGDTVAARRIFRDILAIDDRHIAALLALAATVRMLRERRELFERVLAVEPMNDAARIGLAATDALLTAGALLDPAVRTEFPTVEPAPPVVQEPAAPVLRTEQPETCYQHPSRETGLHCIGCSRPICTQCAERTPVGMICAQCARERLPVPYQVTAKHIALTGLTAFLSGALMTVAATLLSAAAGFFAFFIAFLLGSVAGNFTARVISWVAERKRGRLIMITAATAYVFGALPVVLIFGFTLPLLLFTILAVSAMLSSLR